MDPAASATDSREQKVFSSPSIDEVPVSQHPWSNLEHRTFWTGRRPKRYWPKVFQRRPPPSLPSDAQMGRVSRRPVPSPSSPNGSRLRIPTQRPVQGDDSGRNPCWELPGNTADSPTELASFEQGTYEEVQKELSATAREMALQLRRKQTLQHLEQLQFDEPDMIRIRRSPSREIAELGSELLGPTELPGGEETRASSLDPASRVYELDTLGDSHGPKEGYLTTLEIVEAGHSQTELPFSDLEPVGILDARGHLKQFSTVPSGFNISYSAQDIESRNKSLLPNETEVRTGSHDGHVREPHSSHNWENNEIQSNYTANTTNGVPTDAGLERQRCPSSQVHSRSASGSFTLPHCEGENVNHSLFTDLDTLVKALPARTPCCQRH